MLATGEFLLRAKHRPLTSDNIALLLIVLFGIRLLRVLCDSLINISSYLQYSLYCLNRAREPFISRVCHQLGSVQRKRKNLMFFPSKVNFTAIEFYQRVSRGKSSIAEAH